LAHLKVKECDRFDALISAFKKLHIPFGNTPERDQLYLPGFHEGEKRRSSGDNKREEIPLLQTHNDHRMAMAFTMLALKTGKVKIDYPDSVVKSYPGFWDDLKSTHLI
jgi:3-phosphoshikimate 1-carboxyvinyltransferase